MPVKGREGCKSSYGCGARRQCVCALREAWKSQLMASFPSLSWYKDITVYCILYMCNFFGGQGGRAKEREGGGAGLGIRVHQI